MPKKMNTTEWLMWAAIGVFAYEVYKHYQTPEALSNTQFDSMIASPPPDPNSYCGQVEAMPQQSYTFI